MRMPRGQPARLVPPRRPQRLRLLLPPAEPRSPVAALPQEVAGTTSAVASLLLRTATHPLRTPSPGSAPTAKVVAVVVAEAVVTVVTADAVAVVVARSTATVRPARPIRTRRSTKVGVEMSLLPSSTPRLPPSPMPLPRRTSGPAPPTMARPGPLPTLPLPREMPLLARSPKAASLANSASLASPVSLVSPRRRTTPSPSTSTSSRSRASTSSPSSRPVRSNPLSLRMRLSSPRRTRMRMLTSSARRRPLPPSPAQRRRRRFTSRSTLALSAPRAAVAVAAVTVAATVVATVAPVAVAVVLDADGRRTAAALLPLSTWTTRPRSPPWLNSPTNITVQPAAVESFDSSIILRPRQNRGVTRPRVSDRFPPLSAPHCLDVCVRTFCISPTSYLSRPPLRALCSCSCVQ